MDPPLSQGPARENRVVPVPRRGLLSSAVSRVHYVQWAIRREGNCRPLRLTRAGAAFLDRFCCCWKRNTDAAIAARNVVLIYLIADVTRAYLDLRALQMQLAVLRKSIEVAQKYLDFVQERFSRGITNELDVTLAQRELARFQAQVAPLTAQIEAARYVIAVLIGEFPENLGSELKKTGMLPILPRGIRAGLPIDLLRRRPDIVEAERQLASATAQIGVATADLFPQVAVAASAGRQTGISPLIISSIWSVGPAFNAPLLDFGRLDAIVERADYRSRELFFAYKQTVLSAVRDVDIAVDAYTAQQTRLKSLVDALTAARRAVTLANERFERGLTDSLNVIDAERQQYLIEQGIRVRTARCGGSIRDALQILGRWLGGLSGLPADPATGTGSSGRY
jgi:NodT family efflux transporter outer membrane factor (OMF) lipoprotein